MQAIVWQLHGHLAEGWKGGEGVNVPRAKIHGYVRMYILKSMHLPTYMYVYSVNAQTAQLKINGTYF